MRPLLLCTLATLSAGIAQQASADDCLFEPTKADICAIARSYAEKAQPMLPAELDGYGGKITVYSAVADGKQLIVTGSYSSSLAELLGKRSELDGGLSAMREAVRQEVKGGVCGTPLGAAFVMTGGVAIAILLSSDQHPITVVYLNSCSGT